MTGLDMGMCTGFSLTKLRIDYINVFTAGIIAFLSGSARKPVAES
jgi:hypothetical protein